MKHLFTIGLMTISISSLAHADQFTLYKGISKGNDCQVMTAVDGAQKIKAIYFQGLGEKTITTSSYVMALVKKIDHKEVAPINLSSWSVFQIPDYSSKDGLEDYSYGYRIYHALSNEVQESNDTLSIKYVSGLKKENQKKYISNAANTEVSLKFDPKLKNFIVKGQRRSEIDELGSSNLELASELKCSSLQKVKSWNSAETIQAQDIVKSLEADDSQAVDFLSMNE